MKEAIHTLLPDEGGEGSLSPFSAANVSIHVIFVRSAFTVF